MTDNDEYQGKQSHNDDIDHGVDPFLVHIVAVVDEGRMQEQDLWLCLSGMFVCGRLVSIRDGFYVFMGSLEVFRPQEQDSLEKIPRPRHAYLKDVRILNRDGVLINCPAMRIKLSHVSTWGFGVPDFSQ